MAEHGDAAQRDQAALSVGEPTECSRTASVSPGPEEPPGSNVLTSAMEKQSAPTITVDDRESTVSEPHPKDGAGSRTEGGKSPNVEDLDSFNLIEPPPLDWKSESSSEACSVGEMDDPGSFHTDSMEPPVDRLSYCGPQDLSSSPPPTFTSQEECKDELSDVDQTQDGKQDRVEEEEKEEEEEEGEEEKRRRCKERWRSDTDHSHIQTLLTQLQLFHPTADASIHSLPDNPNPNPDPNPDPQPPVQSLQCESSAAGNGASGLLFTEMHQRDLLHLLEGPDPQGPQVTAPPGGHSVYGLQSDEYHAMSYGQELQHGLLQQGSSNWRLPGDEFVMPSYLGDQLMEAWEQSAENLSEEETASKQPEENAESHPGYKDVPGPCDPEDLLDGVIFGAKYLGSTQLQSEKNPSTNARMAQAQEAVDRIKAPEGEYQPQTEVDLFISTQRIKVLNAETQEAMMDHSLQMISYIADIGNIVVLMARRKPAGRKGAESTDASSGPPKKCWMICHVFTSEDAQVIAQAIGQAFGVAYQQFLQVNGIKPSDLRPGEYSDYLGTQELYNGDLVHFSRSENIREVRISKQAGEGLGVAVVESGWGSILPTVVVANLLHGGPAERCGDLSIGDRIMSVNGTSLVGLPITTCQNIIRDLKNTTQVKLSIVHCPPVTMAIIRRPDPKVQLGFSVEDGIICSLMRGGIAERGGIRVGHRIIEINGQSVVATPHKKIIAILTNAVGEIHLKTMPASTYRLLTGQEQPIFL
ncbi:amyloid-beta A4 precursor protein-binding family A member 3 [Chanos chanos]|uniref:Amyloid-beta A4 precursor protein-binding family A member 3 n=1 Tax=Chanos chanos TaxID=29144 RepID=A0A6J2W7D7_CHACN|nr:amyloid-beta A4 precursor protein-binding family A member 3-like [Chanos chanos]